MRLTSVRLLRTKHPASQQRGVLGQSCVCPEACVKDGLQGVWRVE